MTKLFFILTIAIIILISFSAFGKRISVEEAQLNKKIHSIIEPKVKSGELTFEQSIKLFHILKRNKNISQPEFDENEAFIDSIKPSVYDNTGDFVLISTTFG